MSTAKHTPGPLHVGRAKNGTGDHAVIDANNNVVAETFAAIRRHDERAEAEALANATLYVAAPEMLELVRITIGNIRSLGPAGALAKVDSPYQEWLAQLEAVYAKATGCAA